MNDMKSTNYITICGWMVNEEKLNGNELLCYALIYGFTQDGNWCECSHQYIADWLSVSKRTVITIIDSLVGNGKIEKEVEEKHGVKFCKYRAITSPEVKKLHGGGEESSHDNNSDNNREKENLQKKDIYTEIVDFFNDNTDKEDFPRTSKVSSKIKSAINARIKEGYTMQDIKNAILLMNTLSDWYKGRGNSTWKATLLWLLKDTNGNFAKILEGGLHTTQLQQQQFNDVMRNNGTIDPNEYRPATGGYINFSQSQGMYWTHISPEFGQILDGYKDDTRPDGAVLGSPFGIFKWSAAKRCWYCENND